MFTRRSFLIAAAAAACRPAIAATAEGPAGLRAVAADRGLLYGSYLDLWEFQAEPDYAALAARECGVMVSSRMDWDHLQPSPERNDFSEVDTDEAWARAHDMKFRGHALVWGERAPKWFGEVSGRAAAVDLLENHVAATCRHFAGRMQSWDVVNEAILVGAGRPDRLRPHVFLDKIGPDYIDIAFRTARASDPGARLVYNDFGVEFALPDQLEKRGVLLDLIDGLKRRGTPIDAVGLQSHLSIADMALSRRPRGARPRGDADRTRLHRSRRPVRHRRPRCRSGAGLSPLSRRRARQPVGDDGDQLGSERPQQLGHLRRRSAGAAR
jgi:endo-1,4-beta-xylanase